MEERALALSNIGDEYTTRLNYINFSPDGLTSGTIEVNTGKIEVGGRTLNYGYLRSEHTEVKAIENNYGGVILRKTSNKKQFMIDSDSD